MPIDFTGFFAAFVALFIILDPFLSATVFIGLFRKASPSQRHHAAFVATGVAFSLLFIFLVIGNTLLTALNIDFGSFKVAGGIILLIMGIQQVLGLEFKKSHESLKTGAVVIGTPLLAGAGALSTTLIFSAQYGFLIPFLAIVAVCLITYVLLYFSETIQKIVGDQLIEIASRVLGLLLAAIAISYIRDGVTMFIIGG